MFVFCVQRCVFLIWPMKFLIFHLKFSCICFVLCIYYIIIDEQAARFCFFAISIQIFFYGRFVVALQVSTRFCVAAYNLDVINMRKLLLQSWKFLRKLYIFVGYTWYLRPLIYNEVLYHNKAFTVNWILKPAVNRLCITF